MGLDIMSIFSMGVPQRCFLVWLLLVLTQKKKGRFVYRLLCSSLFFLAAVLLTDKLAAGIIALFQPWDISALLYSFGSIFSVSVISCIIIFVMFFACCDVSIPHAAYLAVSAYIVQTIAYNVFSLIKLNVHFGLVSATAAEEAQWLKFILIPVTYYVLYLGFLSKIDRNKFDFTLNSLFFAAVILLEKMLYVYVVRDSGTESYFMIKVFLVNEIALYCFAYAIQLLIQKEEKYKALAATEMRLRQEQHRQQQTFQENVETLNQKFHDFKHVLSSLHEEENRQKRMIYLRNIEKDISIYDSRISTGNHALDTIITETILRCEENNIQWTCMADGKALEFMEAVDMCRLIGNALDNAVESVIKIDNQDMHFISLNIWRRNQLVFIRIDNYCQEVPEFKNELPVSTKLQKSEHGYGMQSIRNITEQYDGHFSISIDKGIFSLNLMFPVP